MIEVSYTFLLARRAFLLCTLLLATCSALTAQQPDGPPPGGPPPGQGERARGFNVDRQLKHLTQMLSLTTEQQTQVKAILTEQKQQMDALRQSAQSEEGQQPGAGREKMMALRDQTNAKIIEVLNDQQKPTFATWEERQKAQMQRRENGDQPPPPPDGGGPPPGI